MLCNSPNLAGNEPPEIGRNDQSRKKSGPPKGVSKASWNNHKEGWKRKLRREHPERYADQRLNHLYGVSFADKQAQYEKQQGLCAICNRPLPDIHSPNCCVDHKHGTRGIIRALVHRRCNVWLGVIEELGQGLLDNARSLLTITTCQPG
jgi:hypothetical protein